MDAILRRLAVVLPLGLMLAGCVGDLGGTAASSVTQGASPYARGDLGTLTYRAVDLLLAGAPGVTAETPLIVASISDSQNVGTSSTLGNIMADMIRTRIVQDGHATSEIRLRNTISFNKGEGEFLLSRNPRELMRAPGASAVVTGTYAVSTELIYVSIKLVSSTDAHILSAADFVVPVRAAYGMLRHT